MPKKYPLDRNEHLLQFILKYEKNVESGKIHTSKELAVMFEKSDFYKEQFNTYAKDTVSALWWTLKVSGQWVRVKRGIYQKL